jgi:hypothetical protein
MIGDPAAVPLQLTRTGALVAETVLGTRKRTCGTPTVGPGGGLADGVGVGVGVGDTSLSKAASVEEAVVIDTKQVAVCPAQAPVQAVNPDPVSGVAVKRYWRP